MKIFIPALISAFLLSQTDFKEQKITKHTSIIRLDTPKIRDNSKIFDKVDTPATLEGGITRAIQNNIRYPNAAMRSGIEGTVVVSFIVDRDGSVPKDCVKVVTSAHPFLDNESVRAVRLSPKWTPAKNKGIVVRQRLQTPVMFKISR